MNEPTAGSLLFDHRGPAARYLDDRERYFFAAAAPRLRFNLIGCGMMGMEHLRVAHHLGRAAIGAVYDPNERSVRVARDEHRGYGGAEFRVADSLDALCHDPDADALLICTPNDTHIDVLRAALASGKAIFLEKPMTTTLADAAQVVRLAAEYPAPLQIGLQYRYKAIYAEAIHETLQRRALGAVKQLALSEHRIPFLDKVGQWNKFSRRSGGTLVEKCCHYFDLLNLLAGARPRRVYASGATGDHFDRFEFDGERADVLDSACVIIDYANGCRASFSLCMFAPLFHEELVVCGERGRLRAAETEDFGDGPRLRTELELLCGVSGPSKRSAPRYPRRIEALGHNGATWFEHAAFCDALEGGGGIGTAASVADGFWSVAVGVAAERSVTLGAAVDIDELLRHSGVDDVDL